MRNTEKHSKISFHYHVNKITSILPHKLMAVNVLTAGASHAGAVPFVFGFPFFNETILNETELVLRNYYDYQDRNMSDWMMHLWTNFAKYRHVLMAFACASLCILNL